MKYLVALGLIPLSFTALSADVDYSNCQESFSTPKIYGYGGKEDFPFRLEKDGKITAHKDADYVYDKDSNIETIKYKSEGFGSVSETSVVIKRDDKGHLSQVIYNTDFKGFKTQTGLGSNMPLQPGFGFPGYGIGGSMSGPSKSSFVTDIKIKSGKCFPYRSVSLFETNGNTHKSFTNDVELCRDIKKMLKEEGTEGSESNKLKACYEKYQDKAQKILNGHLKRNDDLYNPPEKNTKGMWATGGYYGNPYQGAFSNGKEGSGGYGTPGGFAGSIDNIVQNQMFNPSEKIKILSQYCAFNFGAQEKMIQDDSLFKEEPTQSQSARAAQDSSVGEK